MSLFDIREYILIFALFDVIQVYNMIIKEYLKIEWSQFLHTYVSIRSMMTSICITHNQFFL